MSNKVASISSCLPSGVFLFFDVVKSSNFFCAFIISAEYFLAMPLYKFVAPSTILIGECAKLKANAFIKNLGYALSAVPITGTNGPSASAILI